MSLFIYEKRPVKESLDEGMNIERGMVEEELVEA